eukprot:CAMPEP_0170568244 /NCGR_PEP_ID=MMETSP0211-20121228/81042_1 /TAXON_ID=311385 /ORGANISM="Pseudokeronopsis sp., Strain OXSARD2" /LENGTH=151 /DNA_ID=CAMNT_0010890017 /DNA_START=549 /DNA_END=1002 /DNA_ORIENTATION=-
MGKDVKYSMLGTEEAGLNGTGYSYYLSDSISQVKAKPKQFVDVLSEIGGFASLIAFGFIFVAFFDKLVLERSKREKMLKIKRSKGCCSFMKGLLWLREDEKQADIELSTKVSFENIKKLADDMEEMSLLLKSEQIQGIIEMERAKKKHNIE